MKKILYSKAEYAKEGIGELGSKKPKLYTAEEFAAEGIGSELIKEGDSEDMTPVPPKSLPAALAYVAAGGRLVVATAWRVTIIDAKTVAKFAAVGAWLLKEEGEGYRLRSGKGSVYLMKGQLAYD